MKHRIRFACATLSTAAFALTNLGIAPAAQALPPMTGIADTGVVPLGTNQVLRITVNTGLGNDIIRVAFKTSVYTGTPSPGIWKSMVTSQSNFGPVSVGPDEAATIDIPNAGTAVRALIFANSDKVRITAAIIDGATGEVKSILYVGTQNGVF
jgi:hypothetical protein